MSDVHVVPKGDQWALEIDGKERDAFSTQDEAIIRDEVWLTAMGASW